MTALERFQSQMTRRQALMRLSALGLTVVGGSLAAACQPTGAGTIPAKPADSTKPAGAATTAPATGGQAAGKELTIRFNHTDGRGGEAFFFAERFKELAAERSGGRVKVQTFHSGELGAEKDMFDSMQIGSVEMGRTGSLIISVAAPQYGALDMPYVFRSQQHLRNVLASPIGQEMHQEFLAKKGVRVVGIVDRGPRHLTTKSREVKTPADLRGLKLRVPEIPVYVEAWRALGASPTPMAFPEVFTALQQGTIDGQENPLGTIHGNSFQDVQKYLVMTAHVRGNGWMIASEKFWQSLSDEDRQLLQKAATDAATYADEQVAKQESELTQTLKQKGMTIVEPDTKPFAEIVLKDVPPKFQANWKTGLLEQIQNTQG